MWSDDYGVRIWYNTLWRGKSTKWATDDGKHLFKFPLNYASYQKLKIQQIVFGSKFEKKQGVPLGFFQFFGPKFFGGFLCFDDWI